MTYSVPRTSTHTALYQTPGVAPPHGAPQPIYSPRHGFTALSSSFSIRNTLIGSGTSGTSYLNLGPSPSDFPVQSAKILSNSRLKIKQGPYQKGDDEVYLIKARHPFSQKSTISFADGVGGDWKFREKSQWHEGVAWRFDVAVNGQPQQWEWRRIRETPGGAIERLIGTAKSHKTLGSWELVPSAGGHAAARFISGGGDSFEDNADLGRVEYLGHAGNGGLGDVFFNVSVAVLLRIVSQHYLSRIDALGGGV